jgi:hypothetical protein
LQHRWEELRQHSSKKQCAGIDDNLEICLGRIDALNRIQAAEQKQQELSDEARNIFREIIKKLEATDPLGTVAEDSEGIRALHDSINHMEERWVSATHHAQPSSGQFKAWRSARRAGIWTLQISCFYKNWKKRLRNSAANWPGPKPWPRKHRNPSGSFMNSRPGCRN